MHFGANIIDFEIFKTMVVIIFLESLKILQGVPYHLKLFGPLKTRLLFVWIEHIYFIVQLGLGSSSITWTALYI